MIKAHAIKENSRARRDAARKQKQIAWAQANPLLVGKRYQVEMVDVNIEAKPAYTPTPLELLGRAAKRQVTEYKNQIIRATYLYQYEFKRTPMIDGSVCLADVALYSAGHRGKPKNPFHVYK